MFKIRIETLRNRELSMDFIAILVSLISLVILEIVLGIDNLVLLSILTEKLPIEQRKKARRWGLAFAWITRLMLLACAVSLIKLTKPLLIIGDLSFSARDFFLLFGGVFLIWKATEEIHQEVTLEEITTQANKKNESVVSFKAVVINVAFMDVIFSLDSVLTAVGLTNEFWIMGLAITLAILVMIFASEPVSRFISRNPTVKMLALGFLILIGMVLIADGFSFHIPRGYVYFSMGFSLTVESLNLFKRSRKKRKT